MVVVTLIHCNKEKSYRLTESLSSFVFINFFQALGIPTGPHGAFRDYQVDAITLKVSPRVPADSKARQHDFFQRGAQ